jgi:hypothetical protein
MDANVTDESQHLKHHQPNGLAATRELLMSALLIALLASHGYLVVRAAIRHILNRAIWTGSKEKKEVHHAEREVKEKYLSGLGKRAPGDNVILEREMTSEKDEWASFWTMDEGMSDIAKMVKDA